MASQFIALCVIKFFYCLDKTDISLLDKVEKRHSASCTDRVREIIRIAQDPVSLEAPVGEEEDSFLGDFIPDLFPPYAPVCG